MDKKNDNKSATRSKWHKNRQTGKKITERKSQKMTDTGGKIKKKIRKNRGNKQAKNFWKSGKMRKKL